jgi:hypothetical protein
MVLSLSAVLPTLGRGLGAQVTCLFRTHLEAVKMCLLLAQMALMGLSWPLISPMGVKLSTFQTLMTPARQALSSMGRPGTKARAHTQSLCALGICCGRTRVGKVRRRVRRRQGPQEHVCSSH